MPKERPRTALEAVLWPRLPFSAWPWRSLGYLLATLPASLAALAVLGVPWLVLAAGTAQGRVGFGEAAVLVMLGVALPAALGPVLAGLAGRELRRLRLVDDRPLPALPRRARLRDRYGDPRTWREVACLLLLATAGPVLVFAPAATALLAGALAASPVLVLAQRPGDAPVSLAFGKVAALDQTPPYVAAGVALLALLPYAVTALAGGHAAAMRALLTGGAGDRLRAELREVSRSRTRLADAFEAERRRIERDLHDGAQQRLVGLTLKLGLARLDLPAASPAASLVDEAHGEAKQLMAELRELIHGIRPQILTDLGLPAALGELADRSAVPVAVEAHVPKRLPALVESTVYFVVAEALANAAKHSRASRVRVRARVEGGALAVEVRDDGRGGADPDRGSGLTGLADRVAVTGGRMLLSSPAGGPTVLRVEVPCDPSPPSA
jgi:signal transduction histidine kinase